MKKIRLSGITATGKITLGNYLGALKNMINLQDDKDYELFLFVADMHALTGEVSREVLFANVKENLKLYIACGFDYKKTKLFIQSQISEIYQILWILTTNINEGELSRMTQYKDKKIKLPNKTSIIPMGLSMYPVLMVADILTFNSNEVIVGNDQTQHLELARNLIDRLNKKYNFSFNLPLQKTPKIGSRIMGLKNPTKKMSKSTLDLNDTIFLLDTPDIINKKISTALTDSENIIYYDQEKKPGISNLLTIFSSLRNITIEEAVKQFENDDYGQFKKSVANEIIKFLKPIQQRFNKINDSELKDILNFNIKNIKHKAKNTLNLIKEGIGLIHE